MAQIPDPINISITADQTQLPIGGGSTVLRWATVGIQNIPADTVTLSPVPGGGDNDLVSWDVPVYGTTYNVTVTQTTTFTIMVRRDSDGATATASVTITVALPAYPELALTLDMSSYPCAGALLSWVTKNVDTVTVDQGIGVLPANSSVRVYPPESIIYTVTATNIYGSVTATAQTKIVDISPNGIAGVYKQSKDLSGPDAFTRLDAVISFAWPGVSPAPSIDGSLGYSIRWTGYLRPRYSELYTLSANSDNGVTLKVCDAAVFDHFRDRLPDGQGTTGFFTGTVFLHAGLLYPFEYDFFADPNNQSYTYFGWQSASQAYQVIPDSRLFQSGLIHFEPVVTIEADRMVSLSGDAVVLSWTNAEETASIDQGIGALTGTFGSVTVHPLETTTYTITGSTAGLPDASASVTIVVPLPAVPLHPTATGDCSGTITVTTQSASYATHYLLERSADEGQSWIQIADIIPT
jgi:hypothetical protein